MVFLRRIYLIYVDLHREIIKYSAILNLSLFLKIVLTVAFAHNQFEDKTG